MKSLSTSAIHVGATTTLPTLLLLSALLLNAPLVQAFGRQHLVARRLAEENSVVSNECLVDTLALFQDTTNNATTALEMAYTALEAQVDTSGECTMTTSSNGNSMASCVMDFVALSASGMFLQACQAAGGQSLQVSASITCNLAAASGFVFEYRDMVDCVAASCDFDNVQQHVLGSIDNAETQLEMMQQTTSTGANCTYQLVSLEPVNAPETVIVDDDGKNETNQTGGDGTVVVDDDGSSTSNGTGGGDEPSSSSWNFISSSMAAISTSCLALGLLVVV